MHKSDTPCFDHKSLSLCAHYSALVIQTNHTHVIFHVLSFVDFSVLFSSFCTFFHLCFFFIFLLFISIFGQCHISHFFIFLSCFRSQFHFPRNSRMKEGGPKFTRKTSNFGLLLIKNTPQCKIYHKTAGFYTLRTDAHDQLNDTYPCTTASFPSKSQLFSGILTTWYDPQRSVSPWSEWRPEASAAGRSRRRLVCRCRQRSAGCGGCARMASRNIGRPRGAEAGLCLWCSLHVSSHICRFARDLCVFFNNQERVRAA